MKKFIVITFQFPAIHCWPDCNISGKEYLRDPHRHLFYTTIKFLISHNNRDIEFLDKKEEILSFVEKTYTNKNLLQKSCEQIAEELLNYFDAEYVRVMEDNENGSEIYK